MPIIKLQTEKERQNRISYQYDPSLPPIGEGGMGKVFEGVCVNEWNGSTRPVAIKFMFEDLPESAYERSRRESEIQLRNDNLVEMLGFIEFEEEVCGTMKRRCHVVSELLTGVSLDDLLEGKTTDRNGQDVPYAVKLLQDYKQDPEHFAKTVVMSVLSGVLALHDAGYIHRDIDPSNIMITADGHIKLIDFGIAKQMNSLTTSDKSLTVSGKFMGKPKYAAPELVLGDVRSQNRTTDIYAIGILLYQCIVGHTPFEGTQLEVLEKQLKEKLPLDIIKNKSLRNIIATACQKKQNLRYQTCSEMRVALENMGRNTSSSISIPWGKIAAAVLVVLLLGGGIFALSKAGIFDKVDPEVVAAIDRKLQEADNMLLNGKNLELDNFDQQLMRSYNSYLEAEALAQEHGIYSTVEARLTSGKAQVRAALDSTISSFTLKAVGLRELDEEEIAAKYDNRRAAIEEFKKFKNF